MRRRSSMKSLYFHGHSRKIRSLVKLISTLGGLRFLDEVQVSVAVALAARLLVALGNGDVLLEVVLEDDPTVGGEQAGLGHAPQGLAREGQGLFLDRLVRRPEEDEVELRAAGAVAHPGQVAQHV